MSSEKSDVYKEWVEKCDKKNLDEDIHNASEDNALFLFQALLNRAIKKKQDVKIISEFLLARFYNKLTNELQTLANNNKLEVIAEKEVDNKENNKFYQSIKDKRIFLSATKRFRSLPNFIVVGDSAYRYETDRVSTKAIANFNNKSMGEFLIDMFNDIKKDIQEAY